MTSENIEPIYYELLKKVYNKKSEYLPRILKKLINAEQASIIMELPSSPEELSNKLNIDKNTVETHLQELFEKGVLFPTKKGYQMARNVLQLHDASIANPKFDEMLGEEFFDLWNDMMDNELLDYNLEMMRGDIAGTHLPSWRTVPRWKSIQGIPGVLPSEDIRKLLEKQDLIAIVPCPCKRRFPNRECGTPTNVCITVNRTAQYNINRGTGRKVTLDGVFELLEEIDKYPLVHLALNYAEVTQLLCNCHWCCCGALRPYKLNEEYSVLEGVAKSRFESSVDTEKCNGCEVCLTRCQFDAIEMKTDPATGEKRAHIDTEKCMGCGSCVTVCPMECISMKIVRPPEHIPQMAWGGY